MTLREQIARRLSGMGPEWDNVSHLTFSEFTMQQADEMIRWMEWARRECAPEFYMDVDGSQHTIPLTLPPEDWKP